MHGHLETDSSAVAGGWLYVAELAHRVTNEYAIAISALRLAAAQAPSAESRSILLDSTRKLGAFAAAHGLLRPPITAGQVDLADHLVKLCGTIASARFEDRPIGLSIRTGHPIMLDASHCWRAGLVVSELITNATRHAFSADCPNGEIRVSVAVSGGQITCGVHDTGTAAVTFTPGLGTALINSLAVALGGHVAWRSNAFGTSAELTFPQAPADGCFTALIERHSDLASELLRLAGAPAPSRAGHGA